MNKKILFICAPLETNRYKTVERVNRLDGYNYAPGPYFLKPYLSQNNIESKILSFNIINADLKSIINEIEAYYLKYDFLGISIFSHLEVPIAEKIILYFIDKHNNIIIGGSGAPLVKNKEILKKCYVMIGDSYDELVHYIKTSEKKKFPKKTIKEVLLPDYSELDPKVYKYLIIVNSHGCVKNCRFCSESGNFSTFDGVTAAKRCIELIKKYPKFNYLWIADLEVNGHLKEFMNFCDYLKDNKLFGWYSYFIISDKVPENYFKRIKDSGCESVFSGVESGSYKIRKHMRKNFTNESIINHVIGFIDNNMRYVLSFIVGYPLETDEDFQETLDLLKEIKNRAKNIENLYISVSTMKIHEKNIEEMNEFIEIPYDKYDDYSNWISKYTNQFVRLSRYSRLIKLINNLGFNLDKTGNTDTTNLFTKDIFLKKNIFKK